MLEQKNSGCASFSTKHGVSNFDQIIQGIKQSLIIEIGGSLIPSAIFEGYIRRGEKLYIYDPDANYIFCDL